MKSNQSNYNYMCILKNKEQFTKSKLVVRTRNEIILFFNNKMSLTS